MRSSNLEYSEKLDHLRFFACLLVLVFHTYHPVFNWLTKPGGITSYQNPVNALSVFIVDGHTGVSLFLTLSGYLFARTCRGGDFSAKNFYINRILRIYPLFILVLLLSIPWDKVANVWPSLIFSLLTLQNTPEALHAEFTPHLWTLSCELQFYLVFPVLLWLFRCKHGMSLLLLFMGLDIYALSVLWLQDGQVFSLAYGTTLGRINQCIMGMLLGFSLEKFESRLRNPVYLLFSICLLSLLLQYIHSCGGNATGQTHPIWIVYPTLEAIAWSAVIATYVSTSACFPQWLSRILAAGGALSYSLYVWHFYFCVVLHRMAVPLLLDKSHGPTWWTPMQNWLLIHPFFVAVALPLILVFPCTLFVSFLTYNLVEMPFFSLRQRYVFESDEAKMMAVNWTEQIAMARSAFCNVVMRFSKIAVTAIFALVLIFVVGESVCLASNTKLDAFLQPDERLGASYVPHRRIEWTYEGYSNDYISSAGLRDVEHPECKQTGKKRILILGDSMAEGLQVPLGEIAARRLQKKLDSEFPGAVEVINGAHSNYSLGQIVSYYDELSRHYQPDEIYLVLDNFAVEASIRSCKDYSGDCRPFFYLQDNLLLADNTILPPRQYCSVWRFLLQRSRLANWLVNEDLRLQLSSHFYRTIKKECQIAWRSVCAQRVEYPPPDRREVRDALLSFLNRIARTQGARLTVFTTFYPVFRESVNEFIEIEAQSKREFFDAVSLDEKFMLSPAKCYGPVHLTGHGHEVIAQTMYTYFAKRNTSMASKRLIRTAM